MPFYVPCIQYITKEVFALCNDTLSVQIKGPRQVENLFFLL